MMDAAASESAAASLIPYEGKLLNIFFHPVVARPEIAFTGSMKDYIMNWFVTADEFKKILYELYAQNYVLVNINELYKITYQNDSKMIKKQQLLVPEGKKPMILSIDDLNYYDYMKKNGVVHRLVLDEKNEIAAWTDTRGGGELSYDNDIITILENFIKQNPDFSLRGARGIIALTGFEGVLGYKTYRYNNPGYQKEAEKAAAVVNRLKEKGWFFASHSFNHWNLPKITLDKLVLDTNRWDLEVRPVVGDTDLYIYPYGAGVEAHAEKHRFLRTRGFNLFFGVGNGYFSKTAQEYIYFNRVNIDGTYFKAFKKHPDSLFDIDKVVDKELRVIK